MDLSIIIVNTNEKHVLQPCLNSVYRETTGISFETIVVDNASTDGSREMIESEFPHVRTICNAENLGFAASNNRGIRIAQGKMILLLNPDTEILDGALQKCVSFMQSRSDADILGCKLFLRNGSVQQSVRSFPTVANVFFESTFLYRMFPRSRTIGKYYLSYFTYDSEMEVDWVSGAFLMFKREVLDRIGLLDEQFFMYTEEMDFCFRAKRAGFRVWFYPGAQVVHHWGGIHSVSKRVVLWTNASQVLFFQKHFQGPQLFSLITLKYLGLGLRVVMYFFGGCAAWNKHLFEKTRSYAYTLRKLLTGEWKYDPDLEGRVTPWVAPP